MRNNFRRIVLIIGLMITLSFSCNLFDGANNIIGDVLDDNGEPGLLTSDTATPAPTMTFYPTYTPFPTYTPMPTPTTPSVGEWIEGHFWLIKVNSAWTETELDGVSPSNSEFVVLEVVWEANDLSIKQEINGVRFELVDDRGNQYEIAGMIYDDDDLKTTGPNAKFHPNKWVGSTVTGTVSGTYLLVFDVPSTASNLKLWFSDLPQIDLNLD